MESLNHTKGGKSMFLLFWHLKEGGFTIRIKQLYIPLWRMGSRRMNSKQMF